MARTKAFDEQEVLKKAVELFNTKGYNGTSAQDIVDCLGLSRSSLYATFGDKRGLFLKALSHYDGQSTQSLVAMLAGPGDARRIIENIFAFVIRQSSDEGLAKGCFMINAASELAAHDEDVAGAACANRTLVEKALAALIARGQKSGSIARHHTPKALSRFLFNTMSGLRSLAKAGANEKEFRDVVSVALSVL